MRLLLDETKACALIDRASRREVALGPERHRLVAARLREADAFGDQRAADAEPAGALREDQQPQLRDLVGSLDDEDRADRLAADLGDPAMLARRIVSLDELRDDLGD